MCAILHIMDRVTILYIISSVGIIDTLYLIYHAIRGTPVACPFFPKEWCHTVQYSPYSKTAGIPNAYLGFTLYVSLLLATYFFSSGMIDFWIIQALVSIGFIFSLYFTYIQAFVLRAFCTWCVLSALNFLILMCTVFIFS